MSVSADGTDPGADTAPEDRILLEFLRVRESPCPRCGFNLKGRSVSRCPECGTQPHLALVAPARSVLPLIAYLLPTGFWFGATVFIIFMSLKYGPPSRRDIGPFIWIFLGAACFAVQVTLRNRYLAASTRTQITLAAAVWVLNITVLVWLMHVYG